MALLITYEIFMESEVIWKILYTLYYFLQFSKLMWYRMGLVIWGMSCNKLKQVWYVNCILLSLSTIQKCFFSYMRYILLCYWNNHLIKFKKNIVSESITPWFLWFNFLDTEIEVIARHSKKMLVIFRILQSEFN